MLDAALGFDQTWRVCLGLGGVPRNRKRPAIGEAAPRVLS